MVPAAKLHAGISPINKINFKKYIRFSEVTLIGIDAGINWPLG